MDVVAGGNSKCGLIVTESWRKQTFLEHGLKQTQLVFLFIAQPDTFMFIQYLVSFHHAKNKCDLTLSHASNSVPTAQLSSFAVMAQESC